MPRKPDYATKKDLKLFMKEVKIMLKAYKEKEEEKVKAKKKKKRK